MSDTCFIIGLIKNVQKYPCLWDPTSITFGKRDIVDEAWLQISKSCGKPAGFCRYKWKNVRTGFLRSLTNYPQNNLPAAGKKRRFYLYNYMEFLLPFVPGAEPPQLDTNCQCSNEASEFIKLEENSMSDTLSFTDLEKYGNGLESEKSDGLNVNLADSTNLNTSSQFEKQMDSEDSLTKRSKLTLDANAFREMKNEQTLMSFFKGIVTDVVALPPHRQRLFKRKIVELIDDLHRDPENVEMILKGESDIDNSGL